MASHSLIVALPTSTFALATSQLALVQVVVGVGNGLLGQEALRPLPLLFRLVGFRLKF